jgi:hypothetical protein
VEDQVAADVANLDRRSLTRIFPALGLLAVLRLAFDLRKLLVAAVGLVLLQAGWSILDWSFPASASATPPLPDFVASGGIERDGQFWSWDSLSGLMPRLLEPVQMLSTPMLALLEPGCSWAQMTHAFLGLVWLIVVWAICGGMIARIAVLQIALLRRPGIGQALRFALRRASSLIVAPLCPLLALGSCALFGAAFGVLYHVPALGPLVAGLVLFIPLGLGLVMVLLIAGLLAGWPLMSAAIAAGAEDALDALSRTFSYLNQRMGPLALLLLLAVLEGMIGLLLMDLFVAGVIRLAAWSLSLTSPAGQVSALFGWNGAPPGFLAAASHALWLGVVRLIAHGWIYSFFWTAAAFLYLWLRQDVDGTPWNDLGPRDLDSAALDEQTQFGARTGSGAFMSDSPGLP